MTKYTFLRHQSINKKNKKTKQNKKNETKSLPQIPLKPKENETPLMSLQPFRTLIDDTQIDEGEKKVKRKKRKGRKGMKRKRKIMNVKVKGREMKRKEVKYI